MYSDNVETYNNDVGRLNSGVNTAPVVERPPFRKYGVNDFRYLKVIANDKNCKRCFFNH